MVTPHLALRCSREGTMGHDGVGIRGPRYVEHASSLNSTESGVRQRKLQQS